MRAHALLASLRNDPMNMAVLRETQALLLGEILRTEYRIRGLKAELKTTYPEKSEADLKRFVFLTNRIEGFRRCAFIWRCFGDAIAFSYLDKYALKQTLYSTGSTNQKQDAGFISGKKGLDGELSILDDYLERGVPAILNDITNTIRHGDITLLVGPDPILLEVKSSWAKINPRGRKQARSLELLNKFFSTDKVSGLRGMAEVRRREMPERTYVMEMNSCVERSAKEGYALESPEKGLYYVAMSRGAPDIQTIFRDAQLRAPLVFGWNMAKVEQAWMPYVPFILTLENRDRLWEFVDGKIFILVAVEIERLVEIAAESGVGASYDDQTDPDYPFKFDAADGTRRNGIALHLIQRIGFECVSPEILIRNAIGLFHGLREGPSTAAPPIS